MKPTLPGLLLLPALLCSTTVAADKPAASRKMEFFEKKIRPVLVAHCYKCHSSRAKEVKGKLRLDTREGMRKGGETGPAVVPKNVEKSLILEALRYESFEMPPAGKLPKRVIADFEAWVKMGAPDPRAGKPAKTPFPGKTIDFKQARKFWSFRPPQRHKPPVVSNRAWIRNEIDAFVLAKLEQAGLRPNPRAERRTLVRRLYFSVTGLPPTPEEVDAFVRDDSPEADKRLVDKLLRSPNYGERWARMWLDVARYAEDQAHIVGNNKSLFYPNAYLYRDWVIRALNADMPYDEFIRLQLAADLIEPNSRQNLPALGFIGLGPKYYSRRSPEVMASEWEDRVDTVSRGLLGLTVACARCHDHKYDPIPTEDYYALAGVFASTEMYNKPLPSAPTEDRRSSKSNKNKNKKKKKGRKDKSPVNTMHIIREGKPHDLHVQIRGNYKTKGPLVKRHFLQVLSPDGLQYFTRGSGRAELAEAIVNRRNPLTARVIVNRIWGLHFGRPLVNTPSNFGKLGSQPTHANLLDDLAVRFMEHGWSLKWLHREILLSATWQQASTIVPRKQAADPANNLLWRMNRRRLSVEAWRDALLAVSGRLEREIGGKSIDPQDPDSRRRTVYSRISRLKLNPMLAMFDVPDPNVHSAKRVETTTPLQKMFVLNSPFVVRQAAALARRSLAAAETDAGRIDWTYRLLYGRRPSKEETKLGLSYLAGTSASAADRWERYAEVLLASNEMLFVD